MAWAAVIASVYMGFPRASGWDVGIAVPRFNVYRCFGDCGTANLIIMKKHFLKLALVLMLAMSPTCIFAQAKKAELKAGTVVELRSAETVYARKVEVGDGVRFTVVSDVKQDGLVLVPAGTLAYGVVSDARKSTVAGTKGLLSVQLRNIILGDGTIVPLSGSVHVAGKNRTALAVVTALVVWPCIFIPGTKAVLTEGHSARATVVSNTEIPVGE